MISSIKNGQIVKKAFVINENTKFCRMLLDVLWDEGFILGYKILFMNKIKIYLKYKSGKAVINSIKVVSKPSLRLYYSVKKLKKIEYFLVLTTSQGLKTVGDCKKLNIGGEPIVIIK
jgi:small subunit ribosomal protein S8